MRVWRDCMVDVYYDDGRPAVLGEPGYIVRMSDELVEVVYDDEAGPVCYRGKFSQDGHFELRAPERDGHSVLHQMPNSVYLEGYWKEEGYQGMWRIRLLDLAG